MATLKNVLLQRKTGHIDSPTMHPVISSRLPDVMLLKVKNIFIVIYQIFWTFFTADILCPFYLLGEIVV